jgi:uncharacterized repeat protein (TIGR01451 family)
VSVADTWPAAFTQGTATPSQGTTNAAGGNFTWSVGTLAKGASATLTVNYAVAASVAPGSYTNSATASSTTTSNSPTASDTDTVTTSATLAITKNDGVTSVVAGDGVTHTYTITVSNSGPSDAQNVSAADTWPAAFTQGTATPSQGTTNAAGGNFTWSVGTLAKGASATLTVNYTVAASVAPGSYTNSATASSTTTSNSPTASDTDTVTTSANLTITKSDDATTSATDTVTAGDGKTYIYTIMVSNSGPSDARNVSVSDVWPALFTQGLVSPSQGSAPASGGNFTWSAGTIAASQSATLTAVYTVAATVPAGVVTNSATVTSDTSNTNSAHNSASDSTTVVALTVTVPMNASIKENDTVLLNATVSDPENSARHVVVNWADGSPNTSITLPAGTTALKVAHKYLDDGPKGSPTFVYGVFVTASSTTSAATTTVPWAVTVSNVAPKVSKIGNVTTDEGTTISRAVSFTDPGTLDHWTYSVNWGDGNVTPSTAALSKNFVISHTYADNGVYNASVTVNDDDTGSGSSPFKVTVNNVDPALDPLSDLVVGTGVSFGVTATFSDPGFDNPALPSTESFTATIDWGDSSPIATPAVSATSGGPGVLTTGSFNGTHSYLAPGVYNATATVMDDDGGSDSWTFQVTVDDLTPQRLAGGPIPIRPGTPILTQQQLQPIVAAAIDEWAAAGVGRAAVDKLRRTPIQIETIAGGLVGATYRGGIVIDPTADGYGWFVDPKRTPTPGRVDLLTVVTHEMGNVLGFRETRGNDIMGTYLAPGVRRVAGSEDVIRGTGSTGTGTAIGSPAGASSVPLVIIPTDLATDVAGVVAQTTLGNRKKSQ